MRRVGPVPLVLAGFLSACAGDTPPVVLSGIELSSPAGDGSGEPFLSASGDEIYLSWLERSGSGVHDLRFSRLRGSEWDAPVVIASGDRFFVNWADIPSVTAGAQGTLWAHWLEKDEDGGYGYGIRVSHSEDRGTTWSEPWTPHEDGTPTEHGFVSTVPIDDGVGFLWLDGRSFAPGADGSPPTQEMALYFRRARTLGAPGPETLLDARVCDCCLTDVATTAAGPVAAYRGRSPEEIRDIYVTRWVDGSWSDGEVVHEDGWETGACPVNGPAVAASGNDVAVAWFTAAGDGPHVKVAFSDDAAGTFDEPVVVDGGNPAGRVDLVMLEGGSVLVSWLERTGGEWAEVRVGLIDPDGRSRGRASISMSSAERAGGFPRLIGTRSGSVILAWTDVGGTAPRVRVARIEMEES